MAVRAMPAEDSVVSHQVEPFAALVARFADRTVSGTDSVVALYPECPSDVGAPTIVS